MFALGSIPFSGSNSRFFPPFISLPAFLDSSQLWIITLKKWCEIFSSFYLITGQGSAGKCLGKAKDKPFFRTLCSWLWFFFCSGSLGWWFLIIVLPEWIPLYNTVNITVYYNQPKTVRGCDQGWIRALLFFKNYSRK